MAEFFMPTSADLVDVVRRYLKAIEDGTFSDLENLFTSNVVIEQLPNRIYPTGLRADLSRMSEAFAQGRRLL